MGGCANAGGYIFVKPAISRTIAVSSSLSSFVRHGDHKHLERVSTIDRQTQNGQGEEHTDNRDQCYRLGERVA